jgi:hypothetical protein
VLPLLLLLPSPLDRAGPADFNPVALGLAFCFVAAPPLSQTNPRRDLDALKFGVVSPATERSDGA